MERKLRNYIETIRDGLKSLAEDRTMPMDVQVHDALWHTIQSIDHELETNLQEVKTNSNIMDALVEGGCTH